MSPFMGQRAYLGIRLVNCAVISLLLYGLAAGEGGYAIWLALLVALGTLTHIYKELPLSFVLRDEQMDVPLCVAAIQFHYRSFGRPILPFLAIELVTFIALVGSQKFTGASLLVLGVAALQLYSWLLIIKNTASMAAFIEENNEAIVAYVEEITEE